MLTIIQRRIFSPRVLGINEDPPALRAPLLPSDDEVKEEEEDIESHGVATDQNCRRAYFPEVTDSNSKNNIYACEIKVACSYIYHSQTNKVVEEVKQLVSIAFPMIITSLLIYGKMAVSMHFLGQIGRKDVLAGGTLAMGVANITGYSIISGLSAGMEGISSQAYGARQWRLMSLTLQRTILLLLFACLPIATLWLVFQPVLLFWGQNPAISSIAATYLAFSLPDLFFQALLNPLKIFLRTQKLTNPLMLGSAVALLLHVPINYLIAHKTTLGIRGIALASALTNLNLLLAISLHLKLSGACSRTWTGWSFLCLKEWKPVLGQAIPSCISICLEWWWYEIIIVLSGLLNHPQEAVASSGIIIQATALIYNFPYALSMAVSSRVGNELGANRPKNAKASSLVALCCAVLTGVAAMVITVSARSCWGTMFTKDGAILSLLATTLPVIGVCEIGNCPQTTICGVLRGSARPGLGAKVNVYAFYAVGLPVAVLMGFGLEMGLLGLWMGLLAAQAVCAAAMLTLLATTNWEALAESARELVGGTGSVVQQGLISAEHP